MVEVPAGRIRKPFAASQEKFEELLDHLQSTESQRMSHSDLAKPPASNPQVAALCPRRMPCTNTQRSAESARKKAKSRNDRRRRRGRAPLAA